MENVVIKIQEEFFKELETKTGWGKEDVKKLYLKISVRVMADECIKLLNRP